MRSVICQNETLHVTERPALVPGKGQVLLKVLRCGICGSDLHLRRHTDEMKRLLARTDYHHFPGAADEVVFGHEFCGEILAFGPGSSSKSKVGDTVCAVPLLRNGTEIDLLGLSARSPGAYAEQIIVEESLMMAVPNGLSPDKAALTEPMAVAHHAVVRGDVAKGDVCIVMGCGPVGLAVIAMLRAKGVRTIVASDFSSGRRELAKRCGATIVVNPAESSPFANWTQYGFVGNVPQYLELGVSTREKLGKLPIGWWHAWGLVEKLGLHPKRPIVFECVGVPGVLQQILEGTPLLSRVVVVGVCMQADRIEPALAINKEIDFRFVIGYSPLEFRRTLHMIADGKVDASAMITGTVGLDGVANAFDALGDPERHAKILIDPERVGDSL
jgi:threonine dehydrogenase-like Zn-dependent dehydrogenase